MSQNAEAKIVEVEPDVRSYSDFIDRILATLKADPWLASHISEWRFGDLGDSDTTEGGGSQEQNASSYPLCYVTTAGSPEVDRTMISTNADVDVLPGQIREWEFWAVIVTTGATPADAQRTLYDIVARATAALEQNVRLATAEGKDPLCMSCTVMQQRRLERFRGTLLESMTLRVRPVLVVNYPKKD